MNKLNKPLMIDSHYIQWLKNNYLDILMEFAIDHKIELGHPYKIGQCHAMVCIIQPYIQT